MKRFILTEEDRKHIIGLYEQNVNNLPALGPEYLSSKLAGITKQEQEFFNKKYPGTNLKVDGNWLDAKFNQTMEKYLKEKQIPIHYCKNGDGFCREGEEGVVTTKDAKKFKESLAADMNPNQQANAGEKINTTNDRSYDYKLSNGKYYYSLKNQNKWVEATGKSLESIKAKVKF